MIDEIDLIGNSEGNDQIPSNSASGLLGKSGFWGNTPMNSKRNAVENEAGYVKTLVEEGMALTSQKMFDQAIAVFHHAIALHPNCHQAHTGLGKALTSRHRLDEAFDSYQVCLKLNPLFVDTYVDLGVVKYRQGKLSEAIEYYETAISLDPSCSHAHCNLGSLFHSQHRFEEAFAHCEKAIELLHPFARSYYALGLLLTERFSLGWQEYEYRVTPESDVPWSGPAPQWRGDADISGKTILLYAEQGFGDTLQFVRYVKKVAVLGARIYLQVQVLLKTLLESYPDVEQVLACGETLPTVDYKCPLISLPYVFATRLDSIPADIAYVEAPYDRAQAWSEHLPQDDVPRIGLVWSGNPNHLNDLHRSVHLHTLQPILNLNIAHIFSLQKSPRSADAKLLKTLPAAVDLEPFLRDFSETSAIIANLDLVITIDSAVAHLAGAMGKPVWILLPYTPDFRWMLGRNDSPWYPSVRLFRQSAFDDWTNVIDEVRTALLEFRPARIGSQPTPAVLGGEYAIGTIELRHTIEQRLKAPSLRKQTECGIEWAPGRQICYVGTRQFVHEGTSDATPSRDLARVILAASGVLPWFPEGSADHLRLVDFNTAFLENLMNQILQHAAQESFDSRSAIRGAMTRMGVFANELSGRFPIEIETAYREFCSNMDQETVVRLSPYYFALRRMEQADDTYSSRKLAIRFMSGESTNVGGIVKKCQIACSDVMRIIGSSETIYEHWKGISNESEAIATAPISECTAEFSNISAN